MSSKSEETVEEKEEKVVKVDPPGYETYDEKGAKIYKLTTDLNYKHKVLPGFVLIFTLLHLAGLYGFYLVITFKLKLVTFIWGFLVGIASAEGIILGAHRGFTHNSFKLTTPGQIAVIICQTISGQNNIYWWARDHRLHHKFVDTDADPYNAKRGFFFSHIGWLMKRKHPLVSEKGKIIDMSDLEANKLIMFQKKYFVPMFIIFNILIPTLVPVYFFNEDFWIAFFTCFAYRYVHILNSTWAINSLAHYSGSRPFDERITARQSQLGNYLTLGDGWHNYHHVFPWDHTISEYGFKGGLSTKILYFLKKIGVAYDFKSAPPTVVYKHSKRHGDGSPTMNQLNMESKLDF